MEDRAKIWRAEALGNTLFLAADFRRQRFDRHFHEEFAIGVIESGCQAFAYDSGRRLDFTAGTIALIAPGVVHTGWSGVDDGWRYRMLYPSFDLIRPIVTDIFGDDVMPTFHSPRVTDAGLAQALLSLHGLSGRSEADPLEIDSLLLLIIRHAFERHAGRRAEPGRRTDQASAIRMRDLLESEFSKPIALAALADVVGLSRFQALRQFKSTFGLPPHAFLRQIRVRRAQQLILSGEGLAVAAASVGFADQAHMTRIFRQTLGYTPGALARG